MSLDVKLFILLLLFALIGVTWMSAILFWEDEVPKKKLIIITIISLICCCGIVLLARYTIYKAFTDERQPLQKQALVSNPVFIPAGHERKYDKDNEEHWGDCLSQTPKDGWVFVPWDIRYNGLEEGETYNITITIGKVYESDNGDSLYEGENIDEITASFTPSTSEGEVAYKFYYNPKYVNDGKYKIFADIDN